MKKIILVLLVAICLTNCAAFDKNLTNSNQLQKNNLATLNGQYHITEIGFDSVSKKYHSQLWTRTNFLREIDRKLLKDTLQIDSMKQYSFALKVIHKKKIKIH